MGRHRLSRPIYWKRHQWAVTGFGIERLDEFYPIGKDRLGEEDSADPRGWVEHLREKDGVDIEEFKTALMIARSIFAKATNTTRKRPGKNAPVV